MSTQHLSIDLPYPPSVNRSWRSVGGQVKLSASVRAYRTNVEAAVFAAGSPHLDGRLSMRLYVHPPDRRRRDLDNVIKQIGDSLQHAGVFRDDSQIDELHVWRKDPVKGGLVGVILDTIEAMGE